MRLACLVHIVLLAACANSSPPVLRGEPIGSCEYESPFSGEPECREFFDTPAAAAEESCAGVDAAFVPDAPCDTSSSLGQCTYERDGVQVRTTVYGDSAETCGSNQFGCETFAEGYWQPTALCENDDGLVVLADPFPLAEQVCVDPIAGEAPGAGPDGQVCTWEIVSGATEEGRHFSDYASCEPVIRQRGYVAVPPNERAAEADPRMDDAAYTAETEWVRSQLNAGSCECCHSSAVATGGASVFDTHQEGSLANQFNDRGLAMAAGWVPTVGFGTFPPETNNGFERSSPENPYLSIIPTTDQPRMMAYFEAELSVRGLTRADFEGDTEGAGPLDVQLNFEPERCSAEEGIASDGTIRWAPGRARYVYVLEAGSTSPTVPPNLDLPDGLLWRVDLPADGSPVYSETARYGEVPAGMSQVFPASGAPSALVDGKDYYLYVSADVLYPISRCVFTAGEAAPNEGCASREGGAALGLACFALGLVSVRRGKR